jgi:hypothetical protein
MVLIILFYYFKFFDFVLKYIIVNGNDEFLPTSSTANTTITQVTKITESTVIVPSTINEPLNETKPSVGEIVLTTTKEVIETITELVKDEPSATNTDESVPIEPLTDGMDTSE